MPTPAERAAQKRREKLEDIAKRVAEGTLKIRQMTPAERRSNPPKPPRKGRR